MQIQAFSFNMVRENTYLIWDEPTLEAAVIDCGAFAEDECAAIDNFIAEHGLRLTHSLVTHAHFDHTFGTGHVFRRYGLKAEVSAADAETYAGIPDQPRLFFGCDIPVDLAPIGRTLAEGDVVTLGSDIRLRVIATPGHTPGGISFYAEAQAALFTGDALFRASIGRTDLPGGSGQRLVEALRENVLTLPDDTRVYPGHGPATSVGYERENNAYLA